MSIKSPKVLQYAEYCIMDNIEDVVSPVSILTPRNGVSAVFRLPVYDFIISFASEL